MLQAAHAGYTGGRGYGHGRRGSGRGVGRRGSGWRWRQLRARAATAYYGMCFFFSFHLVTHILYKLSRQRFQ